MSPRAAIQLQRRLAGKVRIEPIGCAVRLVGGIDLAFSMDGQRVLAGAVVYDLKAGLIIEEQLAWRPLRFPYIPGLLSFREAPAALAAVRKLRHEPDVFLFDAQGLAHPRGLGLASHVGLLMNRPTIGCAKSRLCGDHEAPPMEAGRFAPLVFQGRTIGAVLRTRDGVKPLFISVGYFVTLADAVSVTMSCVTRYRLPEPTRLAHQLVTRYRKMNP